MSIVGMFTVRDNSPKIVAPAEERVQGVAQSLADTIPVRVRGWARSDNVFVLIRHRALRQTKAEVGDPTGAGVLRSDPERANMRRQRMVGVEDRKQIFRPWVVVGSSINAYAIASHGSIDL